MAKGGRSFLAMTTNGAPYGCIGKDRGRWLASFAHHDPGYFDLEQETLQPLDSPLGTRLSPMSQVRSVTNVFGLDKNDLAERVAASA